MDSPCFHLVILFKQKKNLFVHNQFSTRRTTNQLFCKCRELSLQLLNLRKQKTKAHSFYIFITPIHLKIEKQYDLFLWSSQKWLPPFILPYQLIITFNFLPVLSSVKEKKRRKKKLSVACLNNSTNYARMCTRLNLWQWQNIFSLLIELVFSEEIASERPGKPF